MMPRSRDDCWISYGTLVSRGSRRSRTGVVERPAAPERLVDCNQADHRVPLALNELVFRRIDRALCVEDGEKALQTARVTVHGELQGPAIRRDRGPERLVAPQLPRLGREALLDLLERSQDRLLILQERLLLSGVLDADVGPDAAPGEDPPAHLGHDCPEPADAPAQG